jgi:DNA-binding transcriptional regulator YiaG
MKKTNWNGDSIRELRQRLKLTQQELADQLGTRQQTISEWETNMYQPRGTSATLLSIVAERAKSKYGTKKPTERRSRTRHQEAT